MLFKEKKFIGALLIALISSAIIFFKFTSIPADFTRDEIEFAQLAVSLGEQPYTPYSELATGHATLYFYTILASLKVFGISQIGLRFPAALFGVLASVMLYLVLNMVFKNGTFELKIPGWKGKIELSTAFVLACIFLSLRWYFGFARFSFEATFVLFLELTSLYAILMFIEKPKRMLWLLVSGLFAGLAYNSYQPGRLFFVIPALTLLLDKKTRTIRNFAAYFGVFGLIIAPLTLYLTQHPDIRIKQQLYLQDETRTASDKFFFFLDNIWRNTKLFFIEGDPNGKHNYPFRPAINLIIATFGLTGLIRSFYTLKNKYTLIFLVWFGIAMAPTLLTYPHENPNMLRTVTVLPSLVYFVGIGIHTFFAYIKMIDTKKVIYPFVGTIAVGLILISSIVELRTYFVFQRAVFVDAFEVKDGFGGLYYFMKQNGYDINSFKLDDAQRSKYNSVPGPDR